MPAISLALLEPLAEKIATLQPDALARAAGFRQRTAKKITPSGFLLTACLFGLQTAPSLSAFAQLWACLHQQTLSKQAVHKRCGGAAVAFLQAVLQSILGVLLTRPSAAPLAKGFRRILVQDSTTLRLPQNLAALFPGPANQRGKKQAALKIQATLDLLPNQWVQFALTPFTCNDQAASPDILPVVQPGDLVIRDLGFLVLKVLHQIDHRGAYFLSRWRYGLQVSGLGACAPADLVALFGQNPLWDGPVLLGKEKLPLRLIAVRLPPSVAAERRRKARANRDKRLHHSPQYLRLLDWHIFITNVPAAMASADQLVKLYALRWRIETIFKTWKSHFNLDQPLTGSPAQILLVILGRLIWITWFSVHFTHTLTKQDNVSLLKLAAWWSRFALLPFLPNPPTQPTLERLILYYCKYEKRKTRLNFLQKLAALG